MQAAQANTERRVKGQIFGVPAEAQILRALSAKFNAQRRLDAHARHAQRLQGKRAFRIA
jgi:hypothetical protein